MTHFRLIPRSARAPEAPVPLGPSPLWIGRDPGCDVVLESRAVSRRHVALAVVDQMIEVTDASANGVLVHGTLLKGGPRVLEAPFDLRVGPATYAVERDPEPLGDGGRQPSRSAGPPVPKEAAEPLARDEEPSARAPAPPREHDPSPCVGDAPDLRRKLHRMLLDRLDLPREGTHRSQTTELRQRVQATLGELVGALAGELSAEQRARLVGEVSDEVLGLGALEPLLADRTVSEIMVVDATTLFVERGGRIERVTTRFSDDEALRAVIERIVTPIGRRIDESNPLVDARLPDGSRVNAVIPPLAVRGPCLTIRRFDERRLGLSDLVRVGSLSEAMARFLDRTVKARRNIVVSGGTGSGKTTLLGALSASIPPAERIVTVEDAAELALQQEHVVTLESRPPNIQGTGAVTIRDLVKNALRMRPDRILVGECRGGEAIDMLQAMNTGHDGSMTTTHANSPDEAVSRLETLCLMSGLDLPSRAIRSQIASSVHVIVQQCRFSDGSRRVVQIAEVVGIDDYGDVQTEDIFRFERTGTAEDGHAVGVFRATGYLPTFLGDFILCGLCGEEEVL